MNAVADTKSKPLNKVTSNQYWVSAKSVGTSDFLPSSGKNNSYRQIKDSPAKHWLSISVTEKSP